MPIDIKIEGNPESIRSAARWLRSRLSTGVHDCASQVRQACSSSEQDWTGAAGDTFRTAMSRGAPKADELAADIEDAGRSFERYADDLHTAQQGMERAKQIALDAQLEVTETQIIDPGPAPADPGSLPANASPQAAQAHGAAVQAQQAHAQKAAAYAAAKQEADAANTVFLAAKDFLKNCWNDFWDKRYLHATEFTNGVVGGLVAKHTSIMKALQTRLTNEAKIAEARYLKSSAGSADAAFHTQQQMAKARAAEDVKIKAGQFGRRVGGKLPVIGLAITTAGVGYDIHTGKPPGKAVTSGLVGAGAAALVASTPVGWGALAAVGVGIGAGVLADYAFDALPDGVRNKINEGVRAVGNAVADGAKSVGNAVSGVWNAVF